MTSRRGRSAMLSISVLVTAYLQARRPGMSGTTGSAPVLITDRGIGQPRGGQRAEVTQFERPQFLILQTHPFSDRYLHCRGREMVVPHQCELFVNRLVDRGHSPPPPCRQVFHLLEQLGLERLLLPRGAGIRGRGGWRPGCCQRSGV